ncbi:DNA polymerase III subunit alpha_gp237 [Bacillus phage vB_BceM_WH1]|nr:DNA polymerase III subunit alpha_gp237 [Bacillus phage vB_BceM_WH1]
MCGLLTIFGEQQEKCVQYIEESKRMGINVLPPDINFSERGFSIDGKALRYGLASIKGMGEAVVDAILAARPFASLEDMIQKVPKRIMNKRVINVLCRSGALDGLGNEHKNRLAILQYLYMLRGDKDDISYEVSKYDKQAMLQDEKQLIGVYVSSHPLEGICEKLNWDYIADGDVFESAGIIRSFKEVRTKRGQLMAMVNLETLDGEKKIVVFPDVYEKLDVPLQEGLIVKFAAYFKFNFQYNERSCLAKKFTIPKRINSQILKK